MNQNRKPMKKFCSLLILTFVCITLGSFSQSVKFNYVSPLPGSEYVNPEQVISLKTGELFDQSSVNQNLVSANGTVSGEITGTVSLSDDGKILFFKADASFEYGESVEFIVENGLETIDGTDVESIDFEFTITPQDNLNLLQKYYQSDASDFGYAFSSGENPLPNLPVRSNGNPNTDMFPGYPEPVIEWYDNPAEGYLYFTSFPFQTQEYLPYLTILDNYGTPVFIKWPTEPMSAYIDFKIFPDGSLCYALMNMTDASQQKYFLMDSQMNVYDTIYMGNGYHIDPHDILLLDNGNYLLMSYDPQLVDMSQVVPGGDTNATVIGLVIQEVDLEQNVFFQWRSWDHFEITDAVEDIDLTAPVVDYSHGNAFDFDDDGNLLISSRHMDEITKIDYETGEIIWRFGLLSENNQFTFLNDEYGFSHQHDIRKLPNGRYSLYDNGNRHTPPFSQAIEYELDEVNMEATLAWNYRYEPDTVFNFATGSHRKLDNGNTLIGWGLAFTKFAITEVDVNGTKIMDVFMPDSVMGYRTLKYNWQPELFTTNLNQIDFGNYEGHYTPIPRIFIITNHSNIDTVRITSTHNHLPEFSVNVDFPIEILPGEM